MSVRDAEAAIPADRPLHEPAEAGEDGSRPAPERRVSLAERPEPLAAPPRPAAERWREAGEEALFQIRRFASESWEEFRRRDRFFKWKAAIVATWTLTSVFAIQVAMAGPADPAANSLGAYVAVTHTSMGWGLLVHNRSDEPWTEVAVEIDGGWVHQRPGIAAEERVVLSPAQFHRGGESAPDELRIEQVRIETDEGSASPQVVR